jgi:hypothetical protein
MQAELFAMAKKGKQPPTGGWRSDDWLGEKDLIIVEISLLFLEVGVGTY